MRPLIALIVVGALLGNGCATLFAGGPDHIPVATNPPGANVYLNGQFVGQTPTVVSLDHDHGGQIQIYLPGFQPVIMVRDKSVSGWFFANLLWFYAVLPIVIDLVTGNWQHFDDEPIAIGLTPASNAPPPQWSQPGPQMPPQQPYPQQPYPQAPPAPAPR